MKRNWEILGLILTAGLMFGSTIAVEAPAAAATSIAGKTCAKKGLIKTVGGYKHTCVLKNKKLVWNTGVVTPKTPISARPSASPSAMPKSANDLLSEKILALYEDSKNFESYGFNLTLCPTVNKTKVTETVAAYTDAMRLWARFFRPKQNLNWVMFSNLDYECWLATVQLIEGPSGDTKVWNPVSNVMGHCTLTPGSFCGYGTGVRPNRPFVQYNAIGITYSQPPQPSVVHHEAVHLYQMALQSELEPRTGGPDLPGWFVEGQANLFGMTIANNGTASGHRLFEIGRIKNTIPGAGNFEPSQWLAKLNELDSQHEFIFKNELGYSLGWLILEKFYQNFSFAQMHNLLVHANKGESWDQSLKLALGTSKEAFYPEIADYLAAEIN